MGFDIYNKWIFKTAMQLFWVLEDPMYVDFEYH